ncbi:hypothetical protein NDU88_002012 [Pleurodeles waltl]|uniref:Uncharacterized protein n=1 Tax=Pleurodeles waltl TaxID=8319 RepID=A0AAV7Q8P3_PLEWA|nr:hypothetical protein NDU88_002012 [Pleurodeles waltl]
MRLLASSAARHVTRGLQSITGMRLLASCAARPVTPEHCMYTWRGPGYVASSAMCCPACDSRAPEYYRYVASSAMCCPACDSRALHAHMEVSRVLQVCGF